MTNKGKHWKHSEETKNKISQSKLGTKYKVVYKPTQEHKIKNALAKLGDKNPNWIGDNVGYAGVHTWIKRRLQKPELCEICNIKPPYDLANITGSYNRNLTNWQWLCRKCHTIYDYKIGMRKGTVNIMRSCIICKSKMTGHWHKLKINYVCNKCYHRLRSS